MLSSVFKNGIRLFRHTLFRHRIIRHGNFATGNIRHRNFCHKFLLRKIRHNNSEMWQKIRMGKPNPNLVFQYLLSDQGISKTDFTRYMGKNCGEIFGQITLGLHGLSQVWSQVGLAQGNFGVRAKRVHQNYPMLTQPNSKPNLTHANLR